MKSLLEMLIEAVQGPTLQEKFEQFISAKNPQTEEELEFYEREFYRTQQGFASFDRYY